MHWASDIRMLLKKSKIETFNSVKSRNENDQSKNEYFQLAIAAIEVFVFANARFETLRLASPPKQSDDARYCYTSNN